MIVFSRDGAWLLRATVQVTHGWDSARTVAGSRPHRLAKCFADDKDRRISLLHQFGTLSLRGGFRHKTRVLSLL
jgi:hypothetical protein